MALRRVALGSARGCNRLRAPGDCRSVYLADRPGAASREDMRSHSRAYGPRAQPRPLRIVGLGSRARAGLLVAIDVRNAGDESGAALFLVRRAAHTAPSGRSRSCRDGDSVVAVGGPFD